MNKNFQESKLRVKGICVAALLLIALMGMTPAIAQDDVVRVTFDRSLLDTPAGVEQLYDQLKSRTRRACHPPVLNSIDERVKCNRQIFSRLIDKLDSVQLTHYAKTGRHLNDRIATAKQ